MNKKNNKKGFTIVELVIVIAVIGILATVLIPTFSGVIETTNESARDQKARNALTDYIGSNPSDVIDGVDGYIVIDGYLYEVADNNIKNLDSKQTESKAPKGAKILYCNSADCATTCTHVATE